MQTPSPQAQEPPRGMTDARSSTFVERNEEPRLSEQAIGDPENGQAVLSSTESPIPQAPEGGREGLDGSDFFAAYFTSVYDLVRALAQAMPYIVATPDIVDFLPPRLAARLKVSVGHDKFAAAEELVAELSARGRGSLKKAVLHFVGNIVELHYCLRMPPESTERPVTIPTTLDVEAARSLHRLLKDKLNPVDEYLASQAVEGCLPDTRAQLLKDLEAKVAAAIERGGLRLIWLKGIVGAGKTSIMATLSGRLQDVEGIAAVWTFFCSRDDVDRSNPHRILTTLAYKLGMSDPGIGQAIEQALVAQETPNAPAYQLRRLILDPLRTTSGGSTVLLIDALDECKGSDGLQQLLRALSETVDNAAPLVFVISSRPDRPIVDRLPSPFATIDLDDECYAPQARDDVRTYLHHNLPPGTLDPILRDMARPEPYEVAMSTLFELSAGYFVFAAFTCSVIKDGVDPEGFLEATLARTGFDDQASMLYDQFSFAIRAALGGKEWVRWRGVVGRVLGVLCCAQQPLTIEDIAALADTGEKTKPISNILRALAPLLACRDNRYTFFHASVSDFIQQISDPSVLFAKVEAPAVHGDMATRCLRIMEQDLRFNLCGVKNGGTPWIEIEIERVSSPLRYAALVWTHHYAESSLSETVPVVLFLKKYFLFWVEMLCSLGKVRADGIGGLNRLIDRFPGLSDRYIFDCQRCLNLWSDEISGSPGHLYLGVLPWLPQRFRSVVEASVPWLDSVLPRLTLGGYEDWPTSLSKWTMPGAVNAVSFLPSGSVKAVAFDHTIEVRSLRTGETRRVFEGHTGHVWSVAFSPDGSTMASGSSDGTVRLWDVQTGEARHVFQRHTDWVRSVAFSPDGSTVASGSDDRTVRLWDVRTGEAGRVFEGHTDWVRSVAFSPDGSIIASGSEDKTVRLWDVRTGEAVYVFEGHTSWVNSVAFSPDGSTVASGSGGRTVRLWDVRTGEARRVLEGHANYVWSVVFSPDGSIVTSGSDDRTVRLWDMRTGEASRVFEGHTHSVNSVAFSPDGSTVASGSSDETVRLWDVQTGEARRVLRGHTGWVRSVAFSHDMQTLISTSNHECLHWDLKTMESRQTHPRADENENLTASEPSPVPRLFLPPDHELMGYSSASHTAVGHIGGNLWILKLLSDDPWMSLCEAHKRWERERRG